MNSSKSPDAAYSHAYTAAIPVRMLWDRIDGPSYSLRVTRCGQPQPHQYSMQLEAAEDEKATEQVSQPGFPFIIILYLASHTVGAFLVPPK